MLFGYESAAMAALDLQHRRSIRNAASVTGTTGRIDLPPEFSVPRTFTVVRTGHAPEVHDFPFEGRGYQYEARHVFGTAASY